MPRPIVHAHAQPKVCDSPRASIRSIPESSLSLCFVTGHVRSSLTGCRLASSHSPIAMRHNRFSCHHVSIRHRWPDAALAVRSPLRPTSGHLTKIAPSLEHMTGHTGLSEASVWSLPVTSFSLRFFTELIHFKHFSFVNVLIPPCVSVLAFSQLFLRS
jgi:hypothetical protein